MLISVIDLEREPLQFDTAVEAAAMDYPSDLLHQIGDLAVKGTAEVLHEHRGPKEIIADIRIRGSYSGLFEVPCARCVDPVGMPLSGEFDLIYRPQGADATAEDHAISPSESDIGYYETSGLLLEDVLREQVLLALPARTLCREDCKGLCPRCGQNLNQATCSCATAPTDPRWMALSELGSRLKS